MQDGILADHKIGDEYFKLSWVAYVVPLLVLLLFVAVGIGVMFLKHSFMTYVGVALISIGLIYFIICILLNRAVKLYMDENGVWVFRGILPWSRGVSGVKWRDIDEASYRTGFTSWIFKSYDVRIGHRFTKSSEIIVKNLKHGNEAVPAINKKHVEYLKVTGATTADINN